MADFYETLGVARDARTELVDPIPQVFYRSSVQWNLPPTTVLARTSLDAASLVGTMQRVRDDSLDMALVHAGTGEEQLVGTGEVGHRGVLRMARGEGHSSNMGWPSCKVTANSRLYVAISATWTRLLASH